MNSPAGKSPYPLELETLVRLFYPRPEDLATFQPVAGEQIPEVYSRLLNHRAHMTVTVEQFYREPVDVRVLQHESTDQKYQREIVLIGRNSQFIVQYGIVRLNPHVLRPEVWTEIAARRTPLGRVLIEHNVLREVELVGLWHVTCGEGLARALELNVGSETYGRTALIYCDGQPAIELLEIVTPVPM